MDLKDYIRKRHGKEANRLEREAMNDPFVQDAIDGFDTVDSDHLHDIQNLENKIHNRISSRKKSVVNRFQSIGIAASIVVLLGIGSLFVLNRTVKLNNPAIVAAINDIDKDTLASFDEENTAPMQETAKEEIIIAKKNDISPKKATRTINSAPIPQQVNIELEIAEDTDTMSFAVVDKPETILLPDSSTAMEQDLFDEFFVEEFSESHNEISPHLSGTLAGVKPELVPSSSRMIVYGKIVDEIGEPIIGASVMLQGTNIGTITDFDGKYQLDISGKENSKLVASYIGYGWQEFSATDSNIIQLQPDVAVLDEVVVIGYGRAQKKMVTGSASAVKAKDKKFGEKEFKVYFEENRKKYICNNEKATLRVEFFIDENGKPYNIEIKNSSCEELEKEFTDLLQNGPKWSKTNTEIKLNIEIQ